MEKRSAGSSEPADRFFQQAHAVQLTAPGKRITKFAYDKVGRLTQVTDAENAVAITHYDAVGNLTEVIDAEQHSTALEYDELNRLTKTTDALQNGDDLGAGLRLSGVIDDAKASG